MANLKNTQAPEQHIFQFVLPRATLSQNKFCGRQGHWAQKQDQKEWILLVSIFAKGIPIATGKRKLTIIRHGHRSLDYDNLVGGCKPLVDAIKRHHEIYKMEDGKRVKIGNGLLVDDSVKWVARVYEQMPLLKHFAEYTLVILEDL